MPIRQPIRTNYFVGLDLGQKQDPTALAWVEWAEYVGAWDAVAFDHRKETSLSLRHLERVPLGTPYPEVVPGGLYDAVAAVGRRRTPVPGGGWDGSRTRGGGPAATGGSASEVVAGDDHERGHRKIRGWILPGTEAGPDRRFAGVDATGWITDRGGDEGGGDAGEGDGGDAGEDIRSEE